jgi:hypothetical protein
MSETTNTHKVAGATYVRADGDYFERRTLRRSAGIWGLWGLAVAAVTAAASSAGNRRRRRAAVEEAAPRWRYAATGSAQITDGHLVFVEANGITRSFDLHTATSVDEPTPGWIRFQPAGGNVAWALQLTS